MAKRKKPTVPTIVFYHENGTFGIQHEGNELVLPIKALYYLDTKIGQFADFIYEEQGLTDIDGTKVILERN